MLGCRTISHRKRGDQLIVVSHRWRAIRPAPKRALQTAHLCLEIAQLCHQFIVATTGDEAAMHRLIGQRRRRGVTRCQCGGQCDIRGSHRVESGLVDHRQRQPQGERFEGHSDRVDVARLLQRDRAYRCAPSGTGDDQPFIFQSLQRIAHWRATHAKRLG
jgi:hypothetical protein